MCNDILANCISLHEKSPAFCSFVIRGDIHEEAILCTKHASYEIRAADTSNALLLLPSLQTPHLKGICPTRFVLYFTSPFYFNLIYYIFIDDT